MALLTVGMNIHPDLKMVSDAHSGLAAGALVFGKVLLGPIIMQHLLAGNL